MQSNRPILTKRGLHISVLYFPAPSEPRICKCLINSCHRKDNWPLHTQTLSCSKVLQLYYDRLHFVEMQENGGFVYSIAYLFASFMAKNKELLELQVKFNMKLGVQHFYKLSTKYCS